MRSWVASASSWPPTEEEAIRLRAHRFVIDGAEHHDLPAVWARTRKGTAHAEFRRSGSCERAAASVVRIAEPGPIQASLRARTSSSLSILRYFPVHGSLNRRPQHAPVGGARYSRY